MNMKKNYKLLLLIIWMIFIFIMSSFDGNASSSQSNFIVNIIMHITNIENKELISLIVRKMAHFTEYFILGILAYNYFKSKNKSVLLPLILCIIYAISDELHQIFTPDRVFQLTDILIDSSGSILGIYILWKIRK